MNRTASAAAVIALALAAGTAGAAYSQGAMPAPVTDPAQVPAGHYVVDGHHAALIVQVRHLGLTHSTFRFNKVDGAFDYDPAHPEATKVTATIDATSFDQGDPAISKDFATKFLGADKNPTITFVSTSIKKSDPTHGVMNGDLTFEGVTKPVALNLTFDGFMPMMGGHAGFSGKGVVKRSDFAPLTMPTAVIGDDVDVTLEIEFTKK